MTRSVSRSSIYQSIQMIQRDSEHTNDTKRLRTHVIKYLDFESWLINTVVIVQIYVRLDVSHDKINLK